MRKITPILLFAAAIVYTIYTKGGEGTFQSFLWNIFQNEAYICLFYLFFAIPIVVCRSLLGLIAGGAALCWFGSCFPDTAIGSIVFSSEIVLCCLIILITNLFLLNIPGFGLFGVFCSIFNLNNAILLGGAHKMAAASARSGQDAEEY